ncbi:MAG: aminomethyl-transferring glycine dehydrogenase subunit GcvPA [Candidatus Dormibacteria bacterium]
MGYLPNADDDRIQMLRSIGASSVDELFASVPRSVRAVDLDLPEPLGEQALAAVVGELAALNRPLSAYDSFLGAGVYQRYIPAIVRATVARPEFYTAYTPYQAEASQGTLQSIFEFQSMICSLTDLEVANASLYDGATAAAEAVLLAIAHTDRHRVAVSAGVNPETLRVVETYCRGRGVEIDMMETAGGVTVSDSARSMVDERHAAFLVAQPSFHGCVESLHPLAGAAHDAGALAVCAVDPFAAATLVPPGAAGFDIAVGDVQPLGIPPSFGGPHAGFMALRTSLIRRLPGRLVGITRDAAGRRAFTLTLQTREQHIRRERATSNICTNHALMALAATVYMAVMGGGGLRCIAAISSERAHRLADQLTALPGFELAFPSSIHLWEFVIRCPGDATVIAAALRARGIIGGLPLTGALADCLLVCCTEMTTEAAIDRYVSAARQVAAAHAAVAQPVTPSAP